MAYADMVFVDMCNDILENGEDTTGQNVRAKWTDTNEPAYTIRKFGVINRYNIRYEFPAITLRRTAIKSAVDEMLWIWQKKSNNVNDLNSNIWDQWTDEDGSIGKAYGYQLGKPYVHHKLKELFTTEGMKELSEFHDYPSAAITVEKDEEDNNVGFVQMDQVDGVIWDLRHNPYSRRILTNIYNHEDLHEMNLYPCAYSVTFYCGKDKDTNSGKLVLNAILNQRSQDILTANNWNVVQYSVLIYMLAQVCDMIPGELIHVISDCHIYDRHIPIIQELISREQYPAPKFWLNPDIKNFYDFTVDDVHIEDYQYGPNVLIPVAE